MTHGTRARRALVIGGSLGGLFTANLLLRQGWDVEVYEQSAAALAGRGAGIIPHPQLFQALARIGLPIDRPLVEAPVAVSAGSKTLLAGVASVGP